MYTAEDIREANNSMMFWYERYTKLEAEMKKLNGEDYEV